MYICIYELFIIDLFFSMKFIFYIYMRYLPKNICILDWNSEFLRNIRIIKYLSFLKILLLTVTRLNLYCICGKCYTFSYIYKTLHYYELATNNDRMHFTLYSLLYYCYIIAVWFYSIILKLFGLTWPGAGSYCLTID